MPNKMLHTTLALATLLTITGCANNTTKKEPAHVPVATTATIATVDALYGVHSLWKGSILCGKKGGVDFSDDAHLDFELIMSDAHIKSVTQSEGRRDTLLGELRGDILRLKGSGSEAGAEPSTWTWEFSGNYAPPQQAFIARGSMVTGGHTLRVCELSMRKQ